jgi:glycosyltransferase involved in cell wall biosynthesis
MRTESRPLKLMHVVDSLEMGGLERVMTDLAIAQKEAGHDVTVFSINDTQGFLPVLEAAGVPVVIGHKRGSLDLKVLRALRGLAANMDVIHSHNFVPNYYSAAAMLGMRAAPVLVSTCHDMGKRLSNRRLRWLYLWSLKRTARVAMVGKQVHDRFVSDGTVPEARALTVLNGIPYEKFTNSAQRRFDARVALGLPMEALVVGCVGRMVALKNHGLLIDQVPALLKQFEDLHVVIIGGGELDAKLKAQVATLGLGTRVLFPGVRNDVADLLPAFDIFALPSQTEGLSIALLEACATGLAIVATNVGGNPEIINDRMTGRLVSANDGHALAEALADLLSSSEERVSFGMGARLWVEHYGSVNSLRLAYDKFYASAILDFERSISRSVS